MLPLLVGCSAHVQHPGTANAFDSDTYDTLLVTHDVIESTKTSLAAGSFPVSIADNVKTALNALITAYNDADAFYCGQPVAGPLGALSCSPSSYHALAVAGQTTPALSAQMQTKAANINTATAALSAAKAGK